MKRGFFGFVGSCRSLVAVGTRAGIGGAHVIDPDIRESDVGAALLTLTLTGLPESVGQVSQAVSGSFRSTLVRNVKYSQAR